MLVSVDPVALVAAVCALEQLVHDVDCRSQVHAGMSGGAVILLEGDDYTGRCVNLAARLVGCRGAHEILATPELARVRARRCADRGGRA